MSKRKKHNPVQRNARFRSYLVKDLGAMFVAGSGNQCETLNFKSGLITQTPYSIAATFSTERFKWYGLLMVVCRDHFGKEYVPAYECVAKSPATQAQIAKDLNETHKKLINSCNKQHVLTVAWIISPHPIDWGELDIHGILHRSGAFNNTAPCEQLK